MKVQIFAIHDAKAKAYNQPYFLHTVDMGIRSFTDAVINTESQFHHHPLDYSLFHIGTYDDETSIITSNCPPIMLTTASQAQAQHQAQQQQLTKIQAIQKHDYVKDVTAKPIINKNIPYPQDPPIDELLNKESQS